MRKNMEERKKRANKIGNGEAEEKGAYLQDVTRDELNPDKRRYSFCVSLSRTRPLERREEKTRCHQPMGIKGPHSSSLTLSQVSLQNSHF